MKKILLIVIDGLGDEPIPYFGYKTPLEAAKTPNLDFLAKNGICGLVVPFKLPKEKVPTSEGTHVALLGFADHFMGRGVYEVAGIGMDLRKGDIAFRVNFATVDKKLKIIHRRAGRISETESLVRAIQGIKIKGINFLVKKSYGHRIGLIMRGKNLSSKISNGDPKKIGVKAKKVLPLDKSKKSIFTAFVLNEFLNKTHYILENHPFNKKRIKKGLLPANYLLTRGAAELKETPTFKKRFGLKSCCIAGGALYKGVASILRMDLIKIKTATGFINTDLKKKISVAKKSLNKYNFVFLHIKAADTLGEDGNFKGKKAFIEKIDKNFHPLLSFNNTTLVITGDHSTCSLMKKHCNRLIPILIYNRKKKDGIQKFSEKNCRKGSFGIIKQTDLMEKLLSSG